MPQRSQLTTWEARLSHIGRTGPQRLPFRMRYKRICIGLQPRLIKSRIVITKYQYIPMRRMASGPAHRLDEFPAGYSLTGCSPALPASSSSTGIEDGLAPSQVRRSVTEELGTSSSNNSCLS